MAKTITASDANKDGKHLAEVAEKDRNGHPKRASSSSMRQGSMTRVLKISNRPAISVGRMFGAGSQVYLTITDGEGNSNRALRNIVAHDNLSVVFVDDLGYAVGDIVEYSIGKSEDSMTYVKRQ